MEALEEAKIGRIVVGRDSEDLGRFGTNGTVCIGRHLVGEGEEAHLTAPLLMDVLRPHVIILCGKRGEGKSHTMGVIAEEMMKLSDDVGKKLCGLIIDTQGIFWTMKFPNEKESGMLAGWGMKPSGFGVSVYIPEGQKSFFADSDVEFDGVFSISPDELEADDWLSVFSLERNNPLGILLQRSVNRIKGRKAAYSIDNIIDSIREERGFENEKLALENRFEAARTWGIFGSSQMPGILEPGKISIIDVSLTPQNVRALLVALVCRNVFMERTKARRKEEIAETEGTYIRKTPLCWIFIDEAHNFVPNDASTASSETLLRIVREGRQPGISMVLATQRPNKLDPDVLAQCDMVISHRLTSKADIDALRAIMQTYMLYDIAKYINELPKLKGVAIVLDDNSERLYTARVRVRQSWHAGSSPVAV